MEKSTTKLFETTLLSRGAKGGGFGASLVFHVVLGITLVSLPVTYVERRKDSERQVVVPLMFPRVAALENLEPFRTPPPQVSPEPAAVPERARAPRFETPAPEKVIPSRANVPIEPAPVLAGIAPVRSPPHVELPPVPAIRPPVRTGLLSSAATAPTRQEPPKLQVQAGKFADLEFDSIQRRNGAAARTGVFEATAQSSAAPGGARQRRVIAANFGGPSLRRDNSPRQTHRSVSNASSFGAATTAREVLGKPSKTVRPTAFEEVIVAQQSRKSQRTEPQKDLSAQVRIIEKLRPTYTAAAREQQIEGEVVLDVLFQASGTIQILGVIKGLGHGLDERATEAAGKIRFQPAEREGKPIDSRARVRITFQLAY